MKALAILLVTLICTGALAAQPKKPSAPSAEELEEKAAALEDEAERLLPEKEQFLKQLYGKIAISPVDPSEPAPKVVGTFQVENGPSYLLKISEPKLLQELQANNNRKIMLTGKIRNEGKYFIAHLIVQQLAAPVERRRRGGI
jgi:hypothetical protein